jgi:hypothetical protein
MEHQSRKGKEMNGNSENDGERGKKLVGTKMSRRQERRSNMTARERRPEMEIGDAVDFFGIIVLSSSMSCSYVTTYVLDRPVSFQNTPRLRECFSSRPNRSRRERQPAPIVTRQMQKKKECKPLETLQIINTSVISRAITRAIEVDKIKPLNSPHKPSPQCSAPNSAQPPFPSQSFSASNSCSRRRVS